MVRTSDQPITSQESRSTPRPRLRWLLAAAGLATLPLVLAFLCIPVLPAPPSGGGGTPASTFNPTVNVSLATTTVGSPSDITLSLDVLDGDVLPAGIFLAVPAGWFVAADAGVADGSLVGKIIGDLTSDQFFSTACDAEVLLDIDLMDATTDTSTTVSGGDEDGDGIPDVMDDDVLADGSPGPNGLPDGVDLYPDFLITLAPGTHQARYFGSDQAGGLVDVFVNVLVDPSGGSDQITIIVGDPTRAAISGANVMCSPWSFSLTLYGTSADNPNTGGTEGGEAVYKNPASSGEYLFTAVLVSELDADNDGKSNGLDNCPIDANASQLDADSDGIGDDCDPTIAEDTNSSDHDGDSIPNGHDNCATVANADQADSDLDDLGDISTDCDPDSSAANGTFHVLYCEDPVGVGVGEPGPGNCSSTAPTATATPSPTATATPTVTPTPTPIPDSDGDGILDTQDNCPSTPNSGQEDFDSDGVGDACDNCPLDYNPDQENADAAIGSYGFNVGTLTSDRIADGSVPNGDPADTEGDACETDGDADNDGLPDGSDSYPGGDITHDDDNDGDPCVPLGTDAGDDGPSWDADCNGVLDGFEGNCPLAVNPNGDDDSDGLKNTWEACKWGTVYDGNDPDGAGPKSSTDSDGDGLGDCTEAADNDGNGEVKFGIDALNSARSAQLPTGRGVGQFGKDGDFDLDGDNDIKFGLDTLFIARASFGLDTDIFTGGDQFCQ